MQHPRRASVALVSIVALVLGYAPSAPAVASTASASTQAVSPGKGYWLASSSGTVFARGGAPAHGSASSLSHPVVGIAGTPTGNGYWLVASDGGIFAFGDAAFHGSTGAIHLNKPIVGMASTPSGHGYWLVASDGGIFAFGDAAFHGSTGAMTLNKPIVGMASTPSGHGYWLVASDGGIFAFGNAAFHGSTGAIHLNKPIVGMASTPSGHGYWLVASDGGIFAFGNAEFHGSTGAIVLNRPIVGMTASATGHGYWFVASDGGVFAFGDAPFFGSAPPPPGQTIVGMAASASATTAPKPPSAAKLNFTTQPSASATADIPFTRQPVVTVQDAGGATVTTSSSSVTLALTTAGGATLACTANPKAAKSGVATFAGCKIDKPGTYTLTATSGSLTKATSSAIVISVGPAARLAFMTQPTDSTSDTAFPTQPVVTIQDAAGNPVTTDTSAVALASTTPAGATLTCDANTVAAVAGVATFSGCAIDLAGTYTLTATDGALTEAVSDSITIAAGPASQLAFTTQPTGSTSGVAFPTQPVVAVQDATGNTVTGDTSDVTLKITTPAGATLTCDNTTVAAVAGIATFDSCKIDVAGTYTLTATAGTLTDAISDSFTIAAGPAAKLAFTTQPTDSTGGAAFPTQPVVTVQDAVGNTVTGDTSEVNLALTTPDGATLTCAANSVAAVAGVATFSGCAINFAGTYTLTATDATLTAAVSDSITIAAGPAAKLAFTTQPTDATSDIAFPTQPLVSVQDAGGDTVTGDTSGVTLAITTPDGAALTCADNPVAAVAGVATFIGCKIDLAGTYTLTATATSLTSAVSASITITAGPAVQLAFTTQPTGAASDLAFASQPVVTVQDAAGNTVANDTSSITLAINGTTAATLTCDANPIAAVAGVATFSGCNIDRAGTYNLDAFTTGSISDAGSDSFTITAGPAAQLAFTTQPTNSTGGIAFPTQPVVTVQDAAGNTVANDTSSITLAINGTTAATLTCDANPIAAVAGVATFSGCNIDRAGTYNLDAFTTGSVSDAGSDSFTITAGPAVQLAFTTQPTGATSDTAFPSQPVVTVKDAGGDTVTGDTSDVTLALTTPAGATLTCAADTVAAVAGVATFSSCAVDRAGTYTLTATDGALTSAVSDSFTIAAGPAVKLAFTTQPTDSTGGTAFPSQPVVTARDAAGNTATTDTSSITLAITNPGGAILTCAANPVTAVAGVATFSGCSIDLAGTYTVTASDGALISAVSDSFTIAAGPPVQLTFTTQPGGATSDTAFPSQPVVTAQDAGGNTATTDASSITLAITNPSGATLTCTANPVTAVAGVATFSGCKIDLAGTYTLAALTDDPLDDAVSSAFTIAAGPAVQLAFTTQPSGAASNTALPSQPVVTAQDAAGNTATTDTSSITLAITNPAGATLSCAANPITAVAGVATFSGCKIDLAGTYTLIGFTNDPLDDALSSAFTITAGPATQLAFTTEPTNSTGGIPFPTQPVVTAKDAAGNTATTDTSSITLAITNPAGATLTCTSNPITAVAGVATFSGCKIDLAGTYTLIAFTNDPLDDALSSALTITAGPATQLAFTTEPTNSTGGIAFPTQPVVTVKDAGGNTVTGDTSGVSLAITQPSAPVGAALLCFANPVPAVAGVATFDGCRIDLASTTTYTLRATDAALTAAVSTLIDINTGSGVKLAFTQQASDSTGGVPFPVQPRVAIQDAGGNTVTTNVTPISLDINRPSDPTGAALTCTPPLPTTPVAGVALFAGCKIDLASATTYTLRATATGLTHANSVPLTIAVGPVAQLVFTQQPSPSTAAEVAFAQQPKLAVQDAGGNIVTSDNTSSVALDLSRPSSPIDAVLSCTATPVTVIAGIATFAGCSVNLPGSYTLTADDKTHALTVISDAFAAT